ncbi:MAG: selenide, water dikinase SelD [Trueperaceae bacterium]
MAASSPAYPRLTRTVAKGGCAAKLEAGAVSGLLAGLPRQRHPDLLVGTDFLDDAAAWRLRHDLAMVQTLDFFTPIVDDPHDFGAIAAANALSDLYAMGAEPVTALTVLAYPADVLPGEVLTALMAGAVATLNEAGAQLVGGHSIDDDTLKLGFAVTGLAHPDRLWTNRGARPGDALVLTKPIGTGTLTGARKNDEIDDATFAEALASMRRINRLALPSELAAAVHAATDVTGFGLAGHALHLANGSDATVELQVDLVPLLHGAAETLTRGILTKAHGSNGRYVRASVHGGDDLNELAWNVLVDPQTSGGLLLAVAEDRAEAFLAHVRTAFPRAARVGTVTARGAAALQVSGRVAAAG